MRTRRLARDFRRRALRQDATKPLSAFAKRYGEISTKPEERSRAEAVSPAFAGLKVAARQGL